MSEPQLAGQIALVTGASRGIGKAIALELAALGLKVIGTATTEDGARAITESLSASAGSRGLCLNVNDGPGVDAAVEAIVKEHGGLHILVNNAGITRDMLSMRMKDDDWDAVLDTNLKGTFICAQEVTRRMVAAQRPGVVINLASGAPYRGSLRATAYMASKLGIVGLTRGMARELGRIASASTRLRPG